MKRMGIEEKLGSNKFVVDDGNPHIKVNKEICQTCSGKPCLTACPASLYTLKNEEISFDFAGCLECGTCRVICPQPGAIDWNYPQGTFGVAFRYG
ncbi:MAG: ferredoxin family protein [Dehalobacterium sp.]